MFNVTVEDLFSARVHYGHRPRFWNPKLAAYIYGKHNHIHIIDLDKTKYMLKTAYDFVLEQASMGKEILFVGTKRVAASSIKKHALSCGMPYVATHWLGGALTNFQTVSASIKKYNGMHNFDQDQKVQSMIKKERSRYIRQYEKLQAKLDGLKNMKRPPHVMFVVDVEHERIAVSEAIKLHIPVVAMVDTNCDVSGLTHIFVGNDDSSQSVDLCVSLIADAVIEGKKIHQQRLAGKDDEYFTVCQPLQDTLPSQEISNISAPENSVTT